jgi:hypothetical protein
LILTHDVGHYIEANQRGSENPLWRYVYAGKPKPFFHPLHTPAGFCISLFEPHDHLWHRGLWFTIKYINEENFWEEQEPFGTQRLVLPPSITQLSEGVAKISHDSLWERPGGAGVVFKEERSITYSILDTDHYALDWDVKLVAQADLLLDRTPFTTWGGYGGLIVRGNRNWQKTNILFPDSTTSDRPVGIPAQWTDLSGVFDGGANATGGVALFDNPGNVRHPQPWYGATGAGHYVNAAFLFHEPMTLKAGETLHLKYRVIVHDGMWDVARLQKAYDSYAAQENRG